MFCCLMSSEDFIEDSLGSVFPLLLLSVSSSKSQVTAGTLKLILLIFGKCTVKGTGFLVQVNMYSDASFKLKKRALNV